VVVLSQFKSLNKPNFTTIKYVYNINSTTLESVRCFSGHKHDVWGGVCLFLDLLVFSITLGIFVKEEQFDGIIEGGLPNPSWYFLLPFSVDDKLIPTKESKRVWPYHHQILV